MLEIKELLLDKKDKLELLFSDVFKKKPILEHINSNPFTKYFILYKNNMIIGFINFDLIYDRVELIDINIIDNEKGNGYSKILMGYMINYSEKVLSFSLEVREDNFIAINLYKKFGFIKKAIRKNYYNGVNGILMIKDIRK